MMEINAENIEQITEELVKESAEKIIERIKDVKQVLVLGSTIDKSKYSKFLFELCKIVAAKTPKDIKIMATELDPEYSDLLRHLTKKENEN